MIDGREPPNSEVTGECWVMTSLIVYSGYCRIYPPGQKYAWAHRYSFELFVESIIEGNVVDHECERKRCVRPEHLSQCTNEENLLRYRQRAARKRHADHLTLF